MLDSLSIVSTERYGEAGCVHLALLSAYSFFCSMLSVKEGGSNMLTKDHAGKLRV